MDCAQAQHEILTHDAIGAPLNEELSEHVRNCATCARTLGLLLRIEETAARDLTTPDSSDARALFLQSLKPVIPRIPRSLRARSWRGPINWRALAAAAVLLVAVATAILFLRFRGANHALAEDATVDRLLDWNLKIADEDSPDMRANIFATQVNEMRSQVDRAALPPDQQQLAARLLENGSWLSSHPDPLAGAERFDDVANLVLDQLHTAAAHDQPAAASRLSRQYNRLKTHGLGPQMKRATPGKLEKLERKKRYDRLVTRSEELDHRLQQILEASPNASRKEIRRQLGHLLRANSTQP
jgi:hypothetical protein